VASTTALSKLLARPFGLVVHIMTTTLVRIHYALTACCIHVCAHARLKMLWAFEHLMLDELSSSGSRTCGLRRGNVYTYLEIET
jgi:hypothetical protein